MPPARIYSGVSPFSLRESSLCKFRCHFGSWATRVSISAFVFILISYRFFLISRMRSGSCSPSLFIHFCSSAC